MSVPIQEEPAPARRGFAGSCDEHGLCFSRTGCGRQRFAYAGYSSPGAAAYTQSNPGYSPGAAPSNQAYPGYGYQAQPYSGYGYQAQPIRLRPRHLASGYGVPARILWLRLSCGLPVLPILWLSLLGLGLAVLKGRNAGWGWGRGWGWGESWMGRRLGPRRLRASAGFGGGFHGSGFHGGGFGGGHRRASAGDDGRARPQTATWSTRRRSQRIST